MPDRVKYKNFYLLSLLIAYLICNSVLPSYNLNGYLVNAGLTFTILLCLNFIAHNKTVTLIIVPLALIASSSYVLLYLTEPTANLYATHFTLNGVFLLIITIVQIKSIAHQEEITFNTLLGAICGYLLLGLTWSYAYLAISHLIPGSFFPAPPNTTFRVNLDYFSYFSFCTLTTLGYGDIVPRHNLVRTLAWMEAAVGQIYLAVWISQLVAIHIAQRIRKNYLS